MEEKDTWIPLAIGVVGIGVMAVLLPRRAEAKKSGDGKRSRNPGRRRVIKSTR